MSFRVFIMLCAVALLAIGLHKLIQIPTPPAPIRIYGMTNPGCKNGEFLKGDGTCGTIAPAYDLYRVADNAPAPTIECKTGYPKLLKDGKWDCGFPEPALKWTVPPVEPVVTLTRGAGASYLTINKDNVQLVVIDMDTGHVKLAPGKSNEAARQFWKAVEANFPVCKKKQ